MHAFSHLQDLQDLQEQSFRVNFDRPNFPQMCAICNEFLGLI